MTRRDALPTRISVARLTLTDFRCYAQARIVVDARPVVLTGPNGAGKTNLLEALSLLVPGRGLRRAPLAEIGRRDGPDAPGRPWAAAATIETPEGAVEIGTGVAAASEAAGGGERRLVRIDGAPARGPSALAAHASAVWVTPEMDRLFSEGASARRRFLDRLVYGYDTAHAARLSAYERALRERARLLREGGRPDPAWLAALEARMAETGVAVAAARREVVARLDAACAEAEGPFPAAALALEGAVEESLARCPALAAEERLRAALAAGRAADAVAGGALTGPHRSDLVVRQRASGRPAAQCSTGEQKALLVGLVLAHARLQALERGAVPLLLLDEAAAHLDARRRTALFDAITALDAQAWLTGTDAQLFAPLGARAQFLTVDGGAVAAPTRGSMTS